MSDVEQMDRLDTRAEEMARRNRKPHIYYSAGDWLVGHRHYLDCTPEERDKARVAWRWADTRPVNS